MRPTPILPPSPDFFPPGIIYLLLLGRSHALLDKLLQLHREEVQRKKLIVRRYYYPDDVLTWKDRREHLHLIILESPTDPLFFREEVGRIKSFFRHTLITERPQ